MAKITSLAELTDVASDDLLVVVDKSDTSMADSGTDKKVKKSSLAKSLLDFFYPVGTIYETTSSDLDTTTKMNNHFGGTWEAYGSGRVLVAKSADTEFDTIGETGGTKTHTHTLEDGYAKIGIHGTQIFQDQDANGTYTYDRYATIGSVVGGSDTTARSSELGGSTDSSSNLQPYIVVYRYRRTA